MKQVPLGELTHLMWALSQTNQRSRSTTEGFNVLHKDSTCIQGLCWATPCSLCVDYCTRFLFCQVSALFSSFAYDTDFGSSSLNLSGQGAVYLLALPQLIAHTEFSSHLPPTGSWQLHFDLPPRNFSQSFGRDKRNKMTAAKIHQCGKSKMCSASSRHPNHKFLLESRRLLIMGIKWTAFLR